MDVRIKKILRVMSKLILLVVGLGLLGYIGYLTYMSVTYRPMKVRISNITESSFTVSWVTNQPMKGIVYYKDTDSVLPGPLGLIGSSKAYDDRDFAYAQSRCVEDFNMNADISEDFTVDSSNFDCENITVSKYGTYYTHHVTLKNLDSEKDYYFRVGDGYFSWDVDEVESVKTLDVLKDVKEPVPIFGKVVNEEGVYTDDSMVYVKFKNGRESKESIYYSSVTNEEGGWYLDGSYIRTEEGELVGMESGQDMFEANGQYMNYDLGDTYEWVFGYFNGSYPDIVVKESYSRLNSSFLNKLLFKVEACSYGDYGKCSVEELAENRDVWGAGNVTRAIATLTNDGVVDADVLNKVGLGGGAVQLAGNISVIAGNGITAKEVEDAGDKVYIDVTSGRPVAGSHNGQDSGETELGTEGVYGPDSGHGPTNNPGSGSELSEEIKFQLEYDSQNNKYNLKYNNQTYDAEKILGSEEVHELKQRYCLGGNCGDTTLLPQEFNVVELILSDSGLSSCLKNGTCNIPGLKEVLEKEMELRKGRTEDIEKVLENFYPISVVDSGGEVREYEKQGDSDTVYFTGSITQEWLDKYLSFASEEEIASFKERYDCPVSECAYEVTADGYIAAVYPSGGSMVTEGKTYKINIEIPITQETYEEMETAVANVDVSKGTPLFLNDGTYNAGTIVYDKENFEEEYGDCIGGSYCNPAMAEKALGVLNQIFPDTTIWIRQKDVSGPSTIVFDPGNEYWREALDKEKENVSDLEEILGESGNSYLPINIVSRTYAQSENENVLFFLPEYGLFSLQLGEYTVTKDVSDGNTIYLFYLEVNGVEGFQIPTDPDNPELYEDMILKSVSSQITYGKQASIKTFDFVKGINIVSFDSLLVTRELSNFTARDFLYEASMSGIDVEYITYFEGGRWAGGLRCSSLTNCNGNNFEILPGRGYLVVSSEAGKVSIPSYNYTSSVPLNLSTGWNLVGIHGYSKAYTARSFIDSINSIEGLTADNVSWWPTSKGMYEGLQVTNGTSYGFDFPISPKNGYFVRINEFKPEKEECKSIIWHEGGDLNGVCGDSKSIF